MIGKITEPQRLTIRPSGLECKSRWAIRQRDVWVSTVITGDDNCGTHFIQLPKIDIKHFVEVIRFRLAGAYLCCTKSVVVKYITSISILPAVLHLQQIQILKDLRNRLLAHHAQPLTSIIDAVFCVSRV